MLIEIDEGSGFCFGVTTAIKKAEEELAESESLCCLGDIVHNGREVERLKKLGLVTVGHEDLNHMHDTKMLLRAHGEPPQTYAPSSSTFRREYAKLMKREVKSSSMAKTDTLRSSGS